MGKSALNQVVVLAGGLGERLGSETAHMPKPLVELGNGPILANLVEKLERDGIRKVLVAAGYKSESLLSYFRGLCDVAPMASIEANVHTGAMRGKSGAVIEVVLVDSGQTGTNGRLASVMPFLGDGNFLICYGDVLSNLNLSRLVAAHSEGDFDLVLSAGNPRSAHGELSIGPTGLVESFAEKPELTDRWVNIGFMLSNHAIFGALGAHSDNFESTTLPQILRAGRLGAHRHHGFWVPIDNLSDLARVREMVRGGDTPWAN